MTKTKRVHFDLVFQMDEREFSRAHRFHLRRALLNVKNIVLVTMALGLAALQAQVLGPASWATRLFGILWLALLGLMAYAFLKLPGRLYRRKPSLQGEFRLEVEDDGIRLGMEDSNEWLDWTTLSRTSENAEFFLFYFTSTLPLILPKRVFSSHEHLEDFRNFVSGRIFPS